MASTLGSTISVGIRTLAGRSTFSVDILKKEGFTPSFGVGLAVGAVHITVPDQLADRLYLAFHGVQGARAAERSSPTREVNVSLQGHAAAHLSSRQTHEAMPASPHETTEVTAAQSASTLHVPTRAQRRPASPKDRQNCS